MKKSTHSFELDDGTTITISFNAPMIDAKCEKGKEWVWGVSCHMADAIFHSKMTPEQKAFVRNMLKVVAKLHNTKFNLNNLGG